MVHKSLQVIALHLMKGRYSILIPNPYPVIPRFFFLLSHFVSLLLYSFSDIVFRICFIVSEKNTISKKGGGPVEKFSPKKSEKEVISMRIPSDLLAEIDRKASVIDISRNEFINQCIVFALSHMEDSPSDN